jgi:hypothetical protein
LIRFSPAWRVFPGCAQEPDSDQANSGSGRALVVPKASIVDAEFGRFDPKLRTLRGRGRMVSTSAYEAGGAAGASLAINPAIRESRPMKARSAPSRSSASLTGVGSAWAILDWQPVG